MPSRLPTVLCLSGHDPVGGAGIHADIEAVAAQDGHALSLITALTVQDSRNVRRVIAVDAGILAEQLALLEQDCRIAAVKIGLLGDASQVAVIASLLDRLRVPAVLDPVLRAGGGSNLVAEALQAALLNDLLPHVSLMTPNAAEARRLAPTADTLANCADALLARGCGHVLITGGDEPDDPVLNTWYRANGPPQRYTWPRLPENFHGAGCTLAAAIAAQLAAGACMADAIAQGQRWTQAALAQSRAVGQGRRIPYRR